MERGRALSIIRDPTKERRWADIEDALDNDEPGWISGVVFVDYKLSSSRQFIVRSDDGTQLKITISCPGYQQLEFRSQQKLKIWLRGAKRKEWKTSAPKHLPFILSFQKGVAISFGGDDELVDLWQAPEPDKTHEKDWFSTPCPSSGAEPIGEEERLGLASSPPPQTTKCERLVSEIGTTPASTPPPQTPQHADLALIEPTLSLGDVDEAENNVASYIQEESSLQKDVHQMEVDESDSSSMVKPSTIEDQRARKRRKRDTRHDPSRESKKRRMHAEQSGQQSKLSHNASETSAAPENIPKVKLSKTEQKRRQKEYVKATTNSVASPSQPTPPKRNPALDCSAGCMTENGAYPALSELNGSKANTWTQVIGVVAKVEPIKPTRSSDMSISITLIDPSNFQGGSGFKVTCFMKANHERFLPTPEVGHVLLLRNVKLSVWQMNVNGVTYPDKLCWVAFSPTTGKLYHKDEAIISARNVATGLSLAFNPFHLAKGKEIAYFVNLGEWWRAVQEEQEKGAIQVQDYTRKGRKHALIGDMDPNIFFNATVEVVMRSNREDQDTFILFSDFTPHSSRSTQGPFGQWAVSAYTSKVHADLLEQMKVGTYWAMKNVRLKLSANGNIELDLYAVKLRELSLDEEEEDMNLRTLLERRKKYVEEHPFELIDRSQQRNESVSLVSDISGPGCHMFIAELVYRSFQTSAEEATDLYVTDYTNNELISQYKPESVKRRLNGEPVFRIVYWGNPDDIRNLEDGATYKFGEVRISADQDGSLKGHTKYAESNIQKVSLRKTSPDVQDFLDRKAAFSSGQIICKTAKEYRNVAPPLTSSFNFVHEISPNDQALVKTRHSDQPFSSIRMIRACNKCPNKFRLKARVIDFYPMDLVNFSQRWCRSCKKAIPETRYACTMCDDMEQKFVEWKYRFSFRLEDEDGESLVVAVNDEGKHFLSGFPPCDLTEGDNLKSLRLRLGGLLGNLVEVHEGLKRKEKVEVKSNPLTEFAIKSWEVRVERKTFVIYAMTGSQVSFGT